MFVQTFILSYQHPSPAQLFLQSERPSSWQMRAACAYVVGWKVVGDFLFFHRPETQSPSIFRKQVPALSQH